MKLKNALDTRLKKAIEFGKDGDKFTVVRTPHTTSDQELIVLPIARTKYSIAQFFKDVMLADEHTEYAELTIPLVMK